MLGVGSLEEAGIRIEDKEDIVIEDPLKLIQALGIEYSEP